MARQEGRGLSMPTFFDGQAKPVAEAGHDNQAQTRSARGAWLWQRREDSLCAGLAQIFHASSSRPSKVASSSDSSGEDGRQRSDIPTATAQ
jgi:hypothetical protein